MNDEKYEKYMEMENERTATMLALKEHMLPKLKTIEPFRESRSLEYIEKQIDLLVEYEDVKSGLAEITGRLISMGLTMPLVTIKVEEVVLELIDHMIMKQSKKEAL